MRFFQEGKRGDFSSWTERGSSFDEGKNKQILSGGHKQGREKRKTLLSEGRLIRVGSPSMTATDYWQNLFPEQEDN
ncbi:hypothetical protein QNI19_26260 [Cytophagaceae bacterium DM2B3-1]|uniref:Uncharacterized protein n=1 Tax=Xanthocytophaga flava TaxID=3048013 RepID=A0ABT7CRW5_9BACT|nr:hypothetical protein [Xanthocytophaga flavus]MDJ1468686.1 hypothetical protein [Xanthocytophaga flavus]MDJ1496467.1 hypothetical protein [Xanthocytophaga flavus]